MRRLALCLLCLIAPLTFAGDWPTFLGPNGDGTSDETDLNLSWSAAGPKLLWEIPIGEGYTAPSIADGRVFVFDRVDDQAQLSCHDVATGKLIWRQQYGTDYEDFYDFSVGPRGAPVVDGDRVFTFGVEGRLRAHNVKDGKLLWDRDTNAEFGVVQNFFGVGSTPIVFGDLLITMVGGSPKDSPGVRSGEVQPNGTAIVAFDKATGKVRYKVGDDLASYASPMIHKIGDRWWGFVFARNHLIGFEPESGKIDFKFPWRAKKLESVNAANPVVVGDRVFITEGYGPGSALLRVKPGGYELLRKDPRRDQSMLSHWATPIHRDGVLYGCSGQNEGNARLRAIEFDSGKVLWEQPGMGRTSFTLVDDHLIVLAERGELLAVRATGEGYQEVSKSDRLVAFPAWNAPVVSDGKLWIRGKKKLKCFDLTR